MSIAAADALAAGECQLSAARIHDDRLLLWRRPDVDVGVVVPQRCVAI